MGDKKSSEASLLAKVWEQHLKSEFELKDADAAIDTMTDSPVLIHVPICAGASGREELRNFYANVFIPQMPDDLELKPLTRTIGQDRIVDEFILKFTHTLQMDWFLPGIAPTGRVLEVPHVGIISFVGDKISSEHIYWDQGTVLLQLGLISADNAPVCGVETARLLIDQNNTFNPLMKKSGR